MSQEESIELLLSNDSFIAWIEDRASKDVAERWERWVQDDPARKKLIEKAIALHKNIGFKDNTHSEIENELKKLNSTIKKYEQSNKRTKVHYLKSRTSFTSAAAIILVLVAALGVFGYMNPDVFTEPEVEKVQNEFVTKSTTDGQKKLLKLSDGSEIILNSNSTVRYPASYYGGDLELWLEGEAFFDIAHKTEKEKRSFTVNVSEGSIKVLGTQFNVNTYDDTEVVLIEGKVSLEKKSQLDQSSNLEYIMQPGELARMSPNDGQIVTNRVNTELYTSWTKDKLILKETHLKEVIKRVEYLYDVEFQLGDEEIEKTRISGSLPNNDLPTFLNALAELLDRSVTKEGRTIKLGVQK